MTRTKPQFRNLLWTGWFGKHKSALVEFDPALDWDTPRRAFRRRQYNAAKALTLKELEKQRIMQDEFIVGLRETKAREPGRAKEMDEKIIKLGGRP